MYCEPWRVVRSPSRSAKGANAGGHIQAHLASGKPAHEPFVQFLDPDLGGSMQTFAAIDRADLGQLQRPWTGLVTSEMVPKAHQGLEEGVRIVCTFERW